MRGGFRGRLSIKTLEHQNGLASERGHCLKPSAGRLSIKENRRLHPPSMMYALLEIPKQGERVTKAPISMATNSSKPVGSNQKGITERAQHKFEFSSSSSFNVNSLPLCKLFIVISVCRLPVRFLRRHFLKISSKLFKKRSWSGFSESAFTKTLLEAFERLKSRTEASFNTRWCYSNPAETPGPSSVRFEFWCNTVMQF